MREEYVGYKKWLRFHRWITVAWAVICHGAGITFGWQIGNIIQHKPANYAILIITGVVWTFNVAFLIRKLFNIKNSK